MRFYHGMGGLGVGLSAVVYHETDRDGYHKVEDLLNSFFSYI
jgi:hypothetical protein